MKISKRRQFLAAGGLAAAAVGYSETLGRIAGKLLGHDAPRHKTAGDAPTPEYRVDAQGNLELTPKQQVSYTTCLGCTTLCGVRVRIDKESGKVLRVAGNPYSPLSTVSTVTSTRRRSRLSHRAYPVDEFASTKITPPSYSWTSPSPSVVVPSK